MGRARIIMRMRYVGRMRCKGSEEVETERVQQQCHSLLVKNQQCMCIFNVPAIM